ncbi:MAG: hypothetical protein ABSF58_12710 [Solirubrobacteraceae bacterium]|jgi:tetratricopeptide (TPR) repeat protein
MAGDACDPRVDELLAAADAAARRDRADEALALIDEALATCRSNDGEDVRACVVKALGQKARVLQRLGLLAEAVDAVDELVAFAGNADDLAVAEMVVTALSRKGYLSRNLGRPEAELQVWDDVLSRYRRDTPTGSAPGVLEALTGRASALQALGQSQEVVAACDEVLAYAAGMSNEDAQEREAWALSAKAGALIDLKQHEAALAEIDRLLQRFGDSADEVLHASVASGLERQAVAYRELGSTDQQLAALTDLTQRFASSTVPDVVRRVSFAQYRQGVLLERLGDEPGALVCYRSFCERVKDTDDRVMRGWWVRGSLRWAAMLSRSGASAEAVSVLDDAVQVLEVVGENDMRDWASLMLARAELLQDVQRSTESLVVLEAIVDRLDHSGEPETRMLIARALIGKSTILAAVGRADEVPSVVELLVEEFAEPALEALDERISQLSGVDDPFARYSLAQGLLTKAGILHDLGRNREAKAIRKRLVAEFKRDADPRIAALAAAARDLF